MTDDDINVAFLRIAQLAQAHGDTPDDGSGLDDVWSAVVPSDGRDHDWHVFTNPTGDEAEADGPGDQSHSIPAYHATIWYGDHLVGPAMMLTPKGGQQMHATRGEFADVTAEDVFIRDAELELERLDFEDFERTEQVHD